MRASLLFIVLLSVCHINYAQNCDLNTAIVDLDLLLAKGEFLGSHHLSDSVLKCQNLKIGSEEHFRISVLNYEALRSLDKTRSSLAAVRSLSESLKGKDLSSLEMSDLKLMRTEALQLRRKTKEVAVALKEIHQGSLSVDQSIRYEFIRTFNDISLEKVDAIPELQKLLEKYNSVEDPSLFHLSRTLENLGNKCRNIGDYEKAVEYHITEMELYKKNYSDQHIFVANAAYNTGNNYYELEDHANALKYYLPCYEIWSKTKKNSNRYMRFLNESIGDMNWELGNNKEALKFFDLSVIDETPVNNDVSQAFINNGDSLLHLGNYGDAINYYQEALKMREELYGKEHALTGSCQNYVARSMRSNGKKKEALKAYQNAICILAENFSDTSIHSNPTIVPNGISNKYLFEALVGKATLLKEQFISTSDENELNSAFNTQKLALEIIDDHKYGSLSTSSKAFWSKKAMPLFESLIDTYLMRTEIYGIDHAKECLEIAEKSKALLLLSSFYQNELSTNAKIPKELFDQENELKEKINSYTGKISLEEQRCSQSRSKMFELWSSELSSLKNEYDLFLAKLKHDHPDYYSLKFELPLASLNDIQNELLDENSAVIEYFMGDKDLYTFVITKNKVDILTTPKNGSFSDLLVSYKESITNFREHQLEPLASYKNYCEKSHLIYELFVEKAIDILDDRINRIIVVPDDILSYLSFGSLLTEQAIGQKLNYKDLEYLFKKYSISYAASSSLKLLAKNTDSSTLDYQGFAPDHTPKDLKLDGFELGKLHFNSREVKEGENIFGGSSWVGNDVTEELFTENIHQAGIVHIASHALLNDEDPMLSKLMFNGNENGNGWLHTYEIYDLRTTAQLIILSGCNTGVGKLQRGEGILSLERAFQYGGCPSLLTSLWTVDDAASSDLSSLFLTHLKSGLQKDMALQKAKIQFLDESNPEKLHPFYWSSLRLVGNTEPLKRKKSWTWLIYTLIVISIFIFLRKRSIPMNS